MIGKVGLKPKPKSRSAIHKELDHLWSNIVKAVADGKCELCGREGQAAHHFFPKGAHAAVRWNPENGVYCCFGCHIRKIHQQGETETARDALIARIGRSKFYELKRQAYQVCKRNKADYDEIRARLIAMNDPEYIQALRNEAA